MNGPGSGNPSDEPGESDDSDRRDGPQTGPSDESADELEDESVDEPEDESADELEDESVDEPEDESTTGQADGSATGPVDGSRATDGSRASEDDDGFDREQKDDPADVPPNRRSQRAGAADTRRNGGGVTIEDDGIVRWFLKTDDGKVVAIRDVLTSVAIVAIVGLLLFGVSGAWPPLVAVESGSMEPNMHRGDLIFVVDNDRFVGDGAIDGTGVVTNEVGSNGDHEKFGKPGDVIIFKPDGNELRTPIIHRAHFWVEEGENWVETKANPDYVGGASCDQLATCPAQHDGFVTKGDANRGYDQAVGGARTDVVKAEWVTGKGMLRVPWLGHVRLAFDGLLSGSPASVTTSVPPGLSVPPGVPGWSPGVQLGLVTVATAAFAGSRRRGSW